MIALKMHDVMYISFCLFVCLQLFRVNRPTGEFFTHMETLFALSFYLHHYSIIINISQIMLGRQRSNQGSFCDYALLVFANTLMEYELQRERFIHGQKKRRSYMITEYLIRISMETCSWNWSSLGVRNHAIGLCTCRW